MPGNTFLPSSATRTLSLLIGTLALCASGALQAASFSQPVNVILSAPGGLTSDGVDVVEPGPITVADLLAPGGRLVPGDGSQIGDFMLPLESIELKDTSILVRIAQGASNGSTGYVGAGGLPASYTFTGLEVIGQQITGLSLSFGDNFSPSGFVGISNLPVLVSNNWISLTSPHSVQLNLDALRFLDRGQGESNNFADIRIDLQLAPVPEPQTWLLGLSGLLALGVVGIRRHRQAH
ncbi:putative secreted protein with PEP-CTERM sorting signal [Aquabacterium commune]|uniref:Putative secreted protein with PEP-CTERM sorting signal n=1 Tax=Aquabacterium commune TaxID=70586 RepID=A0A4R6R567_9BURK|nr:PEP-CTERM sorting domain-containing protein [Aquabacterium commune]TDP80667.1 putative secreted protein with PEP-CTERM sorting signal [Aquabacterium commune]